MNLGHFEQFKNSLAAAVVAVVVMMVIMVVVVIMMIVMGFLSARAGDAGDKRIDRVEEAFLALGLKAVAVLGLKAAGERVVVDLHLLSCSV